jgi:hypothetical protein
MIIDPRFESFLYGRATSEQINKLKRRGVSKRNLAYFLERSESAIKRCLRTPGQVMNIRPTFWMASPVMFMPKSIGYCVYRYSRKKSKHYQFEMLGVHFDPHLKGKSRDYSELDKKFFSTSAVVRWAKGKVKDYKTVSGVLRGIKADYEMCRRIIKRYKISGQDLLKHVDPERFYNFVIFDSILKDKQRRRQEISPAS